MSVMVGSKTTRVTRDIGRRSGVANGTISVAPRTAGYGEITSPIEERASRVAVLGLESRVSGVSLAGRRPTASSMSSARIGSGMSSRSEPTWIEGAGFSKVERLGSNGRERFSRSVAAAWAAQAAAPTNPCSQAQAWMQPMPVRRRLPLQRMA